MMKLNECCLVICKALGIDKVIQQAARADFDASHSPARRLDPWPYDAPDPYLDVYSICDMPDVKRAIGNLVITSQSKKKIDVRLKAIVRMRWWFWPYVYGLKLTSQLTGLDVNVEKLSRMITKAIKIKIVTQ